MGKNRDYVVCARCGDASWQFAYRAWKKPQCKFCGSKWSEWTSKGYRLSDYTTVDNNWQLWQQGGKKNRPPKAQAVLTEVWEFLPQQAKDMIGEAGWNELVRSLWESAEEDQRKVLEKLGLTPKPQPKTSLREMCKLHKEIQDLLEEPPLPKPTARQTVEAANRQFKEATVKLREAIVQKSDLQSKVDKVKEQYTGLLRQLQEANEAIQKLQELVQSKQAALQAAVKDDLVETEDETAAALKKAGLVATKEQAQAGSSGKGQDPGRRNHWARCRIQRAKRRKVKGTGAVDPRDRQTRKSRIQA